MHVDLTKDELKDGDIITLRNGDRLLYNKFKEEFGDLTEGNDNLISDLSDLDDDLTYYDGDYDYRYNDVIRVERPISYIPIFLREDKPVEMTLAEVCRELGYDVKIVKEKK